MERLVPIDMRLEALTIRTREHSGTVLGWWKAPNDLCEKAQKSMKDFNLRI